MGLGAGSSGQERQFYLMAAEVLSRPFSSPFSLSRLGFSALLPGAFGELQHLVGISSVVVDARH